MASPHKTVNCYHNTKRTMTISGFLFKGTWKKAKLVQLWTPSFHYININLNIIRYKTTTELEDGHCVFSRFSSRLKLQKMMCSYLYFTS